MRVPKLVVTCRPMIRSASSPSMNGSCSRMASSRASFSRADVATGDVDSPSTRQIPNSTAIGPASQKAALGSSGIGPRQLSHDCEPGFIIDNHGTIDYSCGQTQFDPPGTLLT